MLEITKNYFFLIRKIPKGVDAKRLWLTGFNWLLPSSNLLNFSKCLAVYVNC